MTILKCLTNDTLKDSHKVPYGSYKCICLSVHTSDVLTWLIVMDWLRRFINTLYKLTEI